MSIQNAINALKNDPVEFLTNNILMISAQLNGLQFKGGLQKLTLVKASSPGTKNGAEVAVYMLKHASDASANPNFDSYWCPFQSNSCGTASLHGKDGPSVMFTAAMDGCTFAAGAPTDCGSRSVTHVNMAFQGQQNFGGVANQRRLQMNVAKGIVGKGMKTTVQAPNAYYGTVVVPGKKTKVATTTFGVRTDSGWDFYSHQYYSEREQGTFGAISRWLACDSITATL